MNRPLPRSLLRPATAPTQSLVPFGTRVFEGPWQMLVEPPTVVGVHVIQAVAVEIVRGVAVVEGIVLDVADTIASTVINGVSIGRRLS